MPFKSKAQMRKCFALKGRGEGKGWSCEEWAHATPDPKALPEHVPEDKKAALDISPEQKAQVLGLLGAAAAPIVGAGIGGAVGIPAGAARGNVSEGLGRGLHRGLLTGGGAGLGGLIGQDLGATVGHGTAGGLAGAGLGGLAGWLGSGALLGKPVGSGHKEEKEATEKQAVGFTNASAALANVPGAHLKKLHPFAFRLQGPLDSADRFEQEPEPNQLKAAAGIPLPRAMPPNFSLGSKSLKDILPKLLSRLTEKAPAAGGGKMLPRLGQGLGIGGVLGVGGAGAAGMLPGQGSQSPSTALPKTPMPAAPPTATPPPVPSPTPTPEQVASMVGGGASPVGAGSPLAGAASGAASHMQASQTPAPQAMEAQGMSPLLKSLLLGGGIGAAGLGAYGLGRMHGGKKEEEHKYASDNIKPVLRRFTIQKLASLRRKAAADLVSTFLDKVASHVSQRQLLPLRILQIDLGKGMPLYSAIKSAYPRLSPEGRGALAARLVKAAVNDYNGRMVRKTETFSGTADKAKKWMSENV